LLCITVFNAAGSDRQSISGLVRHDGRPVAGAIVRVQATNTSISTDKRGRFTLTGFRDASRVRLTAFAAGHYIAGPLLASPGDKNVIFYLKKHPERDNAEYVWIGARGSNATLGNCQICHSEPDNPDSYLPFDEWMKDAHSNSATNKRFLSFYNGTDLGGGNRSPLTRYVNHKEYGKIPLPHNEQEPYFGPGFNLDSPNVAGDCAACHVPATAVRAPYDTDPNRPDDVGKEGVTCDLCHKIWSVPLNPATGTPYPNTPGVLSIVFRRPERGNQLFLGPYDDVAPGHDSYSPLQKQSRICAPCHFAKFWGVQIYNSYGEWLNSPYSDRVNGKTCQDCHMPRRGTTRAALASRGAPERDKNAVFSHLMPGAADTTILQNTARLSLRAAREGELLRVNVIVLNEKAGHHIPTDHPSRNILLVVAAASERGNSLRILKGPLVPDWGGLGDEPDDYGGKPGRGYAKVLEELWTEATPTVAYWNPTIIRQDTRIPALGSDASEYEFQAPPAAGPIRISARLIFRRAFKELMRQKNWNTPDILMNEAHLILP
jgi:mono/diheme cytochrome c family protein